MVQLAKGTSLGGDFTRRLLETCPDCIYVHDLERRRPLYRNRKLHEMLGYEDAELECSQAVIPHQLLHPEDRLDVAVLMARLRRLAPGETFKVEFRMRDRGGRWRHFCSRLTPLLRNPRGETTQILGMITDTSAQKWAEASAEEARLAAERASATKSDFLAHMSHEIRTPLGGVIGAVSLLETTELSPEQHEYTQTIVKTADTLRALVDDVLDFSKIEAGRLDLNAVSFAPLDVLEETTAAVAGRVAAKGIALYLVGAGRLPDQVVGDPGRLRQILLNFLSNAAKFTQAGEIRVAVEASPGLATTTDATVWLRFAVCDTGIGMAAPARERLFQKYVQTEAAVAGCYGGTGLGLAISKELAELMGGRVTCTSEPGVGSEFAVELPFLVPRDRAVAALPRGAYAGRSVLVLSDHLKSGEALCEDLAFGGAEATLARLDSAMWTELVRESGADLVIVDCQGTAPPLAVPVGRDFPRTALVAPLGPDFCALRSQARAAGFGLCLSQPPALRRLGGFLLNGADPEAPPPTAEAPGASARAETDARAIPLILVVDDNPENRAILARMIGKAGYRCQVVASGPEAIEAVDRERPALIFMDLQMPGMNGFDATRAIMQQPGNQGVQVVGLTANVLGAKRADGLAAGMSDILAKPIRLAELRDALSSRIRPEAGRP